MGGLAHIPGCEYSGLRGHSSGQNFKIKDNHLAKASMVKESKKLRNKVTNRPKELAEGKSRKAGTKINHKK
jgi:hypothetical protein